MKIYNSYTNKLEDFKPIHENRINMYVCGPTVYNYIHIGNARPVVFFDTVRRFFEKQGFLVKYVSNFTDVDDRIIQKAIDEGKSELEISEKFIEAFLKDISDLNCKTDYKKPKVTEYMSFIINFIQSLIDRGFAYNIDGDVYFRVEKIDDYGMLSNQNTEDLISGSRIDVNPKKESPLDFTLWKKTDKGVNFESNFSCGRPGWHTECVAMIDDIFHEEIDIHGGGIDLQFPHHENEIAQAEAIHHHHIAKYWMHNGRLSFREEKMSKSLGNVILVKDVEDKMPLRFFLLSTHYRSPINYDEEVFSMYVKEWQKLEYSVKSLFLKLDLEEKLNLETIIEDKDIFKIKKQFDEAMRDDFNTANAITELQSMIRLINMSLRKKLDFNYYNQLYSAITYMIDVLGFKIDLVPLTDGTREIYQSWQEARENKNYTKADELRALLNEQGIL
jgi:cysteinyl-tRNA synthetase